MAEIAISLVGISIAGIAVVVNMATAYGQYRANHPRKNMNNTGPVENYVDRHQGYNLNPQKFDIAYNDMSRYFYTPQPSGHSWSPAPAYYCAPPHGYATVQQPVPNYLGRTATAPDFGFPSQHQQQPPYPQSVHHPKQHHQQQNVTRSNTFIQIPTYDRHQSVSLVLEKQQVSRNTVEDTNVGMHTGGCQGYTMEMARSHWSQFEQQSLKDVHATIAVVNWSERVITMYTYSERLKQYFRNYHVQHSDVQAFGSCYQRNHVSAGLLEDSWLVRSNDEIRIAEDDWYCGVKSSNCWNLLGIPGNIPNGDLVFVEMKRATLFGLLQCRFKDPTLLNVDMVGDDKTVQFVHVDTGYPNYVGTKASCWFSVFSFATNEWAAQKVLVG